MSEAIQARRFEVFGRVQGVGFRYFVRRSALEIGVRGWVRNRADGSVEAVVEGEPNRVARFRAAIGKGPRLSRVDRVVEHAVGPSGCEGFRIAG